MLTVIKIEGFLRNIYSIARLFPTPRSMRDAFYRPFGDQPRAAKKYGALWRHPRIAPEPLSTDRKNGPKEHASEILSRITSPTRDAPRSAAVGSLLEVGTGSIPSSPDAKTLLQRALLG